MKSFFTKLGLNLKETETFLRLLELGAQPISIIAKHTDTPRSTMYLILDRLKDFGLVEFFERRGMKYVKTIPVEQIEDLLQTKKIKLENQIEKFRHNLPELKKLENKIRITPKIKFYEGLEEVEKMYEIIMKLDGYSAYFNPESLQKASPKYFDLLAQTYIKRQVKARELMVDCPAAREYAKKYQSKYYEFKILPAQYVFFSDTLITKERVFMISYGQANQICGTEIFDPALAQSQMAIYNALWERI